MEWERFLVRFWAKVNKNGPVMPGMETPCWEWTASTVRFGYGQIKPPVGRGIIRSHRAAWVIANGPIPAGMRVLHRCDNPRCCRSEPGGAGHLYLGTALDNVRDMYRRGRENFAHRVARMMRGEAHIDAKLTAEAVREVRRRHEAGETYAVLALAYGVSKPTVAHACQRRSWAHVA